MADPATLVMPKLGLTMTEGTVTEWKVQPGGRFKAGDILVVVETDKIANEVEAAGAGIMGEHVVPAGQTVPVGALIARWQPEGGSAAPAAAAPVKVAPRAPTPRAAAPVAQVQAAPRTGERVVATPLARRVAKDKGVDLRNIAGSGPNGRIKAADVEKAAGAPVTQKATAPALQVAAQFFVTTEVRAGELLALQRKIAALDGMQGVTVGHLVRLGVGRALRANPEFNGGSNTVNVGTAAGVLRDVGAMSVSALLAAEPGEAPCTISIFDTGENDATYMSASVPAGQSATLGVGSLRATFRPDAQGKPMLSEEIGLVLTCSASAFDNARALAFLRAIKACLENPLRILVG